MGIGDTCDTPTQQNDDQAESRSGHDEIGRALRDLLEDLQQVAQLGPSHLLVVGASSSEVIGKRIGTATSMAVGRQLVEVILSFAAQNGCQVAFQCCEHLNRSLVVERAYAEAHQLAEVSAVPVPGAGGAVASAAYFAMARPCLVAAIQADAGIDIGDTLIGMHLRPVAVPIRGRTRQIGAAHVTMAKSRPPLIGGVRAMYDLDAAREFVAGNFGASANPSN